MLKITVNPAATAKPTATPTGKPTATPSTELEITKHPTGETVKEGGKTSFIARADNDTSRKWYFEKDSETVLASDAESRFPGLKVSGTREEKLALSNIPVSVNGWSVYCTFTGKDGKLSSKQAKITVTASATATPATTSQPTASAASVSATPTLAPTAPPTATPEPHTHAFGAQWQSDATQHWQACACGEKANAAEHVVAKWVETRKATKAEPGQETGVCAVCGRIVMRSVAYTGGADIPLLLLIAVLMLTAVVSVLIILLVQKRSRSNRRRIREDDSHRPE